MPDWAKVIIFAATIIIGTLEVVLGLVRKEANYARSAFGVGLMILAIEIAK